MLTRTCDRCHQPILGSMTYGLVSFGEAPVGSAPTRDLCLACLADLRAWMDPGEVPERGGPYDPMPRLYNGDTLDVDAHGSWSVTRAAKVPR